MSGINQRSKNGSRSLRGGHIVDVLDWLRSQNITVQPVRDAETKREYTVVEKPLGEMTLSLCGVFDGIYNRRYHGMDETQVRVRTV